MNPIRRERHRIGLTTGELAVAIGVSTPMVGVWERGEVMPSHDRIRTLADALGQDVDGLRAELLEFRDHVRREAIAKIQSAAATDLAPVA